jgi:hypothetical protein
MPITTRAPRKRPLQPQKHRPTHSGAQKCRRKFLRFFPKGFHDATYIDWERDYKWQAHERWESTLSRDQFNHLLRSRQYTEASRRAIALESRTNLLFSFEKMALRDAVRSPAGAQAFATGLFEWIYSDGNDRAKFERWVETVESLPRKQTRVLTWPLVTVFGFIALPAEHFFLKPMVTRLAARRYGYEFRYQSRPNWDTYSDLLTFADVVRSDLQDLRPRDMIDIQSFLWVQGSDEY